MLYFAVFVILLFLLKGYFIIADHLNIVDKPNERSSHSHLTIRGGGILFPLATLAWFLLYGFVEPWIILAMLLLAAISFIDDILTLSSGIRILAHFAAVSLLFWQLNIFGMPWYIIFAAYLLTIGWINAFNFMDGINGITVFYSLVTICSFLWINMSITFIPNQLLVLLIISALIFSYYNARVRAITFAGDVGSVTMAFLLAWFMISLILKTGRFEYILFFAVYGIDSVFTIFFRLLRHENIFEAHRTHLFQYLSNEIKWPQILVSSIFGSIQLIINAVTIFLIEKDRMTLSVFVLILLTLSILYLTLRFITIKSIQKRSFR
ncbi:MAG: UDP-GlcNAc--UDP-phosphate GlcNAc-1-phosphate transferase [Draconibacterium sp.]|nr:UDP-GlcNAc--UDP-phosphate GlcNAc-1-phosphate transferase [Draconibacterium sp.]